MTKGGLTRGLGLTAALALIVAAPAQAADGDVVKHKPPYPLKDSERVVVRGDKVAVATEEGRSRQACRMPTTALSLSPREDAVELRQLSLNRRTCRATFERGVPPKWTHPKPRGKPESSGARRSGSDGGVSVSADGYRFGGYSRAWYRDDWTGKIVNQVYSGADWNRRGWCVGTNNIWFSNFAHRRSGWDEVFHRWSYIDDRCRYVVSSVNARFRDPRFNGCDTRPVVNTQYRRVRFVGYANGGMRAYRRSWTDPSCKGRLTAFHALYRR